MLEIEEVNGYVYLGTLIDNKCREEIEINLRIAKNNRYARGINRILRSNEVKIRLYKTTLRPTLIYGSETWTLNKTMLLKLETGERKILRRILGGKKIEDIWEGRTNDKFMTHIKNQL